MTIEQLTDDERVALCNGMLGRSTIGVRVKAIRIIDALTEELATAKRKAESWERGHDHAWELKVAAESECAALRAVLAAAKALTRWEPCQAEPEEDDDGPLFDGFLTDPDGTWVRWEGLARVLAAQTAMAPARDEAEQAVLDAVEAYVSHWKRTAGDDEIGVNLRCDVISAELARRGLK